MQKFCTPEESELDFSDQFPLKLVGGLRVLHYPVVIFQRYQKLDPEGILSFLSELLLWKMKQIKTLNDIFVSKKLNFWLLVKKRKSLGLSLETVQTQTLFASENLIVIFVGCHNYLFNLAAKCIPADELIIIGSFNDFMICLL